MKRAKDIFLLLTLCIVVAFSLNSCHKYKEDSFISWKRPYKRLEGAWKFTGYKINNSDHNHEFDTLLAPKTLLDCEIIFHTYYNLHGWYEIKAADGTTVKALNSSYVVCFYYFENDYADLSITSDTTTFYKGLWKGSKSGYAATKANWKILELHSKYMHLNHDNIDLYFRKE